MNNQDYEQKRRECWKEYCEGDELYDVQTAFDFAYRHAYNLGKQFGNSEQVDADTMIQGWVAIDEAYNECYLHTNKPTHEDRPIADTGDYESHWRSEGQTYLLDADLFPDMDGDSEPQECKIIIKRKKQ